VNGRFGGLQTADALIFRRHERRPPLNRKWRYSARREFRASIRLCGRGEPPKSFQSLPSRSIRGSDRSDRCLRAR